MSSEGSIQKSDVEEQASNRLVHVLHVDADSAVSDIVSQSLERQFDSFELLTETTVREGLDRLDSADVDCVIADYDLPEMDGLQFLEAVRERYPTLPFVLFAGDGSEEVASNAIAADVSGYVPKRDTAEQYATLADRVVALVGRDDETDERPVPQTGPGRASGAGFAELEEREEVLREMYEIISETSEFETKLDALLEMGQDVLDTKYATLSQVHGSEYLFEKVCAPEGTVRPGDTVPLSETNCERAVTTEKTLVIENMAVDAPNLATRPGNVQMGIACYLGAPVFVDGQVYGTFCFYDDEPREKEFSEWEVTFVDLLSRWVSYELERQRSHQRVTALNNLNRVVRKTVTSILEQSTHEEIERTLCEALVQSDSYRFAWIAEVETAAETVRPRVQVGDDEFFENPPPVTGVNAAQSHGLVEQAFLSGEVQVVDDVLEESESEKRRDHARTYDYRSSIAVPITFEDTTYGVLCTYAERPRAFDGEEGDVLGHLGEIVGHAIAANQRKQAQFNSEVLELEFSIRSLFDRLGVSGPTGGTLDVDQTISLDDGKYLLYGSSNGAVRETLEALVEREPRFERFETVRDSDDEVRFELQLSDLPAFSTIESHGGSVSAASIDEDDFDITAEFPLNVDVKEVLADLKRAYPETNVLAKRRITRRDQSGRRLSPMLPDTLTDRQEETLKMAYFAGFFQWPRDKTGEELAELLNIAPATFHQHLRLAQQNVFDSILTDES